MGHDGEAQAGGRGRVARLAAGAYRWQSVLAALIAAAAAIVVAVLSSTNDQGGESGRASQATREAPQSTRTVVGITSISPLRSDPATAGNEVLIAVKGKVVNLAEDRTVVVVATKRTSASDGYAFAWAAVDRQTGAWEADLSWPRSERSIPSLVAGTMELELPMAARTDCLPGLCPSEEHETPSARLETDGPKAKGFIKETSPTAVPAPRQSTAPP
ncbi:hypothetical protein [Streptomyces sp. NPDC127112]|uniref:hypothetical protein n=1 Tax=Streptomyces sp. NPDC127112 TaxID=3345364 RepID=UPI003626E702